jgi:hypothetical protein
MIDKRVACDIVDYPAMGIGAVRLLLETISSVGLTIEMVSRMG